MTFTDLLLSGFRTAGGVVVVMLVLALLEAVVPARRRGPADRAHLAPNLALTAITFATNAVMNALLVLGLAALAAAGYAPLQGVGLGTVATTLLVVAALDFTWYATHRTMHRVPWLWRIHRVHHSDPAVDVTTTIRQHPAEGVVRYATMGAVALAIGAGPAAFAVYRIWSVMQGLFAHSNLRLPWRLEAPLARWLVMPSGHRLHHSRHAHETDSNYANIFACFDRWGASFTAPTRGVVPRFGLDGFDDPARQTTVALLRS